MKIAILSSFTLNGLSEILHVKCSELGIGYRSFVAGYNQYAQELINSKILNPLNKLWFRFGIFLGKIISPIIMGTIFFLVVTPIGIIMRLFRKDLLNLKSSNIKSYWVEKNGPKSKMKNQF